MEVEANYKICMRNLLIFVLLILLVSCKNGEKEEDSPVGEQSLESLHSIPILGQDSLNQKQPNIELIEKNTFVCKDTLFYEKLSFFGQKIGEIFKHQENWLEHDSITIQNTDIGDLKTYHYGKDRFITKDKKLFNISLKTDRFQFKNYPELKVNNSLENLTKFCFSQNRVKEYNRFYIFSFSSEFNVIFDHSLVFEINDGKISEIHFQNYEL